jgi:hypothetical protein
LPTGRGFEYTMPTILYEEGSNTARIETLLANVEKNTIRGTFNHALCLKAEYDSSGLCKYFLSK